MSGRLQRARRAALEVSLGPAEPLWKRAPARDHEGRPLSDFMMLLPRLGQKPAEQVGEAIARLEAVFARYRDAVVFADLNLRLNVLWVTVRPIPGICAELPAAILERLPEARLVADRGALGR